LSGAPDRFETIAWVYSQSELAVLLSLFEHEDIFVLPVTRYHISVDWALTVALGGVEIRVHPEDAERAWALFAGHERTAFRGRVFVDNRLLDIALMLAIALFAGVPPPARIPAFFVTERRLSP
jgi:hypothetical protein